MRIIHFVSLIFSSFAFCFIIKIAYKNTIATTESMNIPIITCQNCTVKIQPINPGGIIIPNQDKSLYTNIKSNTDVQSTSILPNKKTDKMNSDRNGKLLNTKFNKENIQQNVKASQKLESSNMMVQNTKNTNIIDNVSNISDSQNIKTENFKKNVDINKQKNTLAIQEEILAILDERKAFLDKEKMENSVDTMIINSHANIDENSALLSLNPHIRSKDSNNNITHNTNKNNNKNILMAKNSISSNRKHKNIAGYDNDYNQNTHLIMDNSNNLIINNDNVKNSKNAIVTSNNDVDSRVNVINKVNSSHISNKVDHENHKIIKRQPRNMFDILG